MEKDPQDGRLNHGWSVDLEGMSVGSQNIGEQHYGAEEPAILEQPRLIHAGPVPQLVQNRQKADGNGSDEWEKQALDQFFSCYLHSRPISEDYGFYVMDYEFDFVGFASIILEDDH